MRLKVETNPDVSQSGRPVADYPLRPFSFFASAGVHWLVIAALFTIASVPAVESERPVYEELIKPHENKILFYDFRREVPDVAPLHKVGESREPRGAELSKQAIIATSPKPKSKQVFISVPAPKTEIQQDLPAPLLIARMETMLPTRVEAPKPKNFVPPSPSKREPRLPINTPVIEAPAPSTAASTDILRLTPHMPQTRVEGPKPKNFVPPPPSKSEPKLPTNTPEIEAPAPSTAASTDILRLTPAKVAFSAVAAPARKAPEASIAQSGNAEADIAVASLHPSPNADVRLPNGARPASFSKAPMQGATASDDPGLTAAVTVPDLTVRQPKPEPEPPPSIPRHEVLYSERVRSIPISTLSVPLRPANRMIPQSVDARFRGRNVYTIVIPMEHMPAYSGDWIMWFADRESKPGETPVVRAPIPFQKLEPVDQTATNRTGARIQFAAILRKDGKLDGTTLVTQANPAVTRAVFEDVTAWEFRPASRDGVPVDVDVVIEIPFRLPVQ